MMIVFFSIIVWKMMIRIFSIGLFGIFWTCSMSKDLAEKFYPNRTIVPSRSIYDLVQLRLSAARLAKTYHNRTMQNTTVIIRQSKNLRRDLFFDHLKIIVGISSAVVLLMASIVIICILIRYYHDKHPTITERAPEKNRRTTQYTRVVQDNRNFSRKQRPPRTNV